MLKDTRVKKGISQKKLAEMLSINQSTISKYETGRKPNIKLAFRISNILGESVETIFGNMKGED